MKEIRYTMIKVMMASEGKLTVMMKDIREYNDPDNADLKENNDQDDGDTWRGAKMINVIKDNKEYYDQDDNNTRMNNDQDDKTKQRAR